MCTEWEFTSVGAKARAQQFVIVMARSPQSIAEVKGWMDLSVATIKRDLRETGCDRHGNPLLMRQTAILHKEISLTAPLLLHKCLKRGWIRKATPEDDKSSGSGEEKKLSQ